MTSVALSCLHCYVQRQYRTEALHLTLFSTGVVHLEFFCLSCREENHQQLGAELGQRLAEAGVSATVVRVPLEVVERQAGPMTTLTAADVAALEDMSDIVFNEKARRELGLLGG